MWASIEQSADAIPYRRRLSEKERIFDAAKLAQLANVADQQGFEKFRSVNPRFLPPAFWSLLKTGKVQIVFADPTRAKTTLTLESWVDLKEHVRAAWEENFPADRCIILITLAASAEGKLFFAPSPFQEAVMFLATDSWRARFCSVCGSCFVAEKPATRFCSLECSGKSRSASRNRWWRRHGKKWREKYQRRTRAQGRSRPGQS